jgi:DNA-binding NtrC family response regulator
MKQLVTRSIPMQQILASIGQIAPTNVSVLILGESGTGKELVARTIHAQSTRHSEPFIAVNCAALPETLLESELFGSEKGAFTDAREQRKGRFELAHGGTLFLDEIGDLTPATQVKFLRVLEEAEIMRLGGVKPIKIDARIIAATNKNLELAIERNEFRQDLYYRLKVITVTIPPLRERREDIPLLVDTFITDFCAKNNLEFPGITPEAMEVLVNYSWPGNVRELQNLVKNLIILSPHKKVDPSTVPRYLFEPQGSSGAHLPVRLNKTVDQAEHEIIYRAILDLKKEVGELKTALAGGPASVALPPGQETMDTMERELIKKTLESVHYNKKLAARKLGIGERTIYRKITKYGLE